MRESVVSAQGDDLAVSAAEDQDWVVLAQDGHAIDVLRGTDRALAQETDPGARAHAAYARALALHMLGDTAAAIEVAQELADSCREHTLVAAGLQGRALLVDLLRRVGRMEEAVEQLAQALALEPGLTDLEDPQVQAALGALGVALRLFGVADEARAVEARLEAVEASMPRNQRVARWSNLALEHAIAAMVQGRRPPFRPDVRLLERAVTEIGRATLLSHGDSYHVVADEERVLRALCEAVAGDARQALHRLEACRHVLELGQEGVPPQLLWGAAWTRALVRLGRTQEAVRTGRELLSKIEGSGVDGDRLVLAYEVMRAEAPEAEHEGSGVAAFVHLAEERLGDDIALLEALFRARVDLLRGADERRLLAQAASLDPLTGLVNRRGATAAVEDACRRPAGEEVALLLLDLDGFKEVNDTCGHLAGDLVLQRVAGVLRAAARAEDVVARWGGDEFVVVAVLDTAAAVALADRLREAVRTGSGSGDVDAVTLSVGVAVRRDVVDDDAWLRRADVAMYAAKRAGGDATVIG